MNDCRRLFELQKRGGSVPSDESNNDKPSEAPGDETLTIEDERRALFTGEAHKRRGTYPASCRICKRSMEPLEQMDGQLTLRILPYLIGVMAWLSGKADGPPKKVPLLVPEHLRVFVADEQRAEERRQQQEARTEHASLTEHPPP